MNRIKLACALLAVAAPSAAAVSEPTGLAANLRPAAGEEAAFVLGATGVQIYACKPGPNDPNAFAWTFVAPEATLLEGGATVGRHYAGPTWESSSDRSSVKGAVKERQDGGAGNIPWLLLAATPSGSDGRFAGVTSILRVATKGGVAPKDGCEASKSGEEARVPYTADYYFYKRK
jgi:uncharacterized protein DUF3455